MCALQSHTHTYIFEQWAAKPNKIIKNPWHANFIYRNSNSNSKFKYEIQITSFGQVAAALQLQLSECSSVRCKRRFCYQITRTHTHGWTDRLSMELGSLLRIRRVGHVSQSSLRPGRQKMFAIIAYTNEAHVTKPNKAAQWVRASERETNRIPYPVWIWPARLPAPFACRVHWTRMIFACWKFWLDLITV